LDDLADRLGAVGTQASDAVVKVFDSRSRRLS